MEPDPAAPPVTLLRLEGRDALGVLHRLGTAHLEDLEPGQARATLFCDFRGRLLHRAVVAVTSDRAVWVLRDDAPAGPLAAHIDQHVFREDLRVADHGAGRHVRAVPGGVALVHGTLREADGIPVAVQVDAQFALAIDTEPAIEPDEAMARARIAAGRPRHGHEITEAFNPFEVNLSHEVHLSKGCYTGQEALQRLVTYRSVRRRLVRAQGPGEPPAVPCDVHHGDARAGVVTSAVPEPLGGWTGLAVLRHEVIDAGARLEVDGAPLEAIEPFPLTRPAGLP